MMIGHLTTENGQGFRKTPKLVLPIAMFLAVGTGAQAATDFNSPDEVYNLTDKIYDASQLDQGVVYYPGPSGAADSTPASTYTITSDGYGSGYFTWDEQQPTGSGVFQPFVRVQQNGEEQGYNTTPYTGKNKDMPFETKPDGWTYDVSIDNLEKIEWFDPNTNTTKYVYEFYLDIAENNSENPTGDASLISLDGLRLFSANVGGQIGETVFECGNNGQSCNPTGDTLGDWDYTDAGQSDGTAVVNTLLWDLDLGENGEYLNRAIILDANRDGQPGNGTSDMVFRVDASAIDDYLGEDNYFVLWSRFGLTEHYISGTQSFASFEEWNARVKVPVGNGGPPGLVPAPGSLALVGLGLLGLYRRQRHAKRA